MKVKNVEYESLFDLLEKLIEETDPSWKYEKELEEITIEAEPEVEIGDSEIETIKNLVRIDGELSILPEETIKKIFSSEYAQFFPVIFRKKLKIVSNFGDDITNLILEKEEEKRIEEFEYSFIGKLPVLTLFQMKIGSRWKEVIMDDEEAIVYSHIGEEKTVRIEEDSFAIKAGESPEVEISSSQNLFFVKLKKLPSLTVAGTIEKIVVDEEANNVIFTFSRCRIKDEKKTDFTVDLTDLLDVELFESSVWSFIKSEILWKLGKAPAPVLEKEEEEEKEIEDEDLEDKLKELRKKIRKEKERKKKKRPELDEKLKRSLEFKKRLSFDFDEE